MGLLGDLFSLPSWVSGLSPFDHVSMVPAEPFAAAPIVVLTAIAAAGGGAGVVAGTKRDVA